MTNAFSKHFNGVSYAPKFESGRPDMVFQTWKHKEIFENSGFTWNSRQGNWVDKWGNSMILGQELLTIDRAVAQNII